MNKARPVTLKKIANVSTRMRHAHVQAGVVKMSVAALKEPSHRATVLRAGGRHIAVSNAITRQLPTSERIDVSRPALSRLPVVAAMNRTVK
ncbi:MAG: hypothetical protein ABR568_21020 [Pyrinomonadaceae bacterium]